MADFTNRQLAQIIAQSAEKINSNVLKERKIANELSETVIRLEQERSCLESKIEEIRKIEIKPDLSALNSLYIENTEENIKRVNSRLKVPNLSLYVWLSSLLFVIIGFLALYLAYSKAFSSREDIIQKYRSDLLQENAIIPLDDFKLFKDMDKFFQNNPKTKDKFVDFRTGKK